MSSYHTTLCVVNFSGKDIETTAVSDLLPHDWDYDPPARTEPWRPDLNFTGTLARESSRCEREEINAAATRGAWFKLTFTFTDGSTAAIRINQREALTKMAGVYTDVVFSPPNAALEVYRATGECRDEGGGKVVNNAFYIRPKAPPDNSAWMRALLARNPDLKLNEITMPGSHDAGMYADNNKDVALGIAKEGGGEWAVTQHLTILAQLEAGARYFDLRTWCDDNQIVWTYHGGVHGLIFYGAFGGKLEDILNDVSAFLTSPGGLDEVVILKLTSTDYPSAAAPTIQATVHLVTSKLGDLLYMSTSTTALDLAMEKLSDLRGSGKKGGKAQGTVVAVFAPAFASLLSPASGLFPYRGYGGSADGLPVYDVYSDTAAFTTMMADQGSKLQQYGGYAGQYLFLYSWTLTGKLGGKVGHILDLDLLSRYVNPELPKQIQAIVQSGAPRPNIVYLDNVDAYLSGAIIATNPATSHPSPPIRQFHAANPYRYYYAWGMSGVGWESDGIVFYSVPFGTPGAVPVNEFHARDRNPDRYYYTLDTADAGWVLDGTAFYAYRNAAPNTVPIYQFHAKDRAPDRYFYTPDPSKADKDWVSDGIVFHVYDRG